MSVAPIPASTCQAISLALWLIYQPYFSLSGSVWLYSSISCCKFANLLRTSISLVAFILTQVLPVRVFISHWYTHIESVYRCTTLAFHWNAKLIPFIVSSNSARFKCCVSFIGQSQPASFSIVPWFSKTTPIYFFSSHTPSFQAGSSWHTLTSSSAIICLRWASFTVSQLINSPFNGGHNLLKKLDLPNRCILQEVSHLAHYILFTDCCWKIVTILISLTKYRKIATWMMEQIFLYVDLIWNLVFQDCSTKIQKVVEFNTFLNRNQISSWSKMSKFMALVKIVGQQVPHHWTIFLWRQLE